MRGSAPTVLLNGVSDVALLRTALNDVSANFTSFGSDEPMLSTLAAVLNRAGWPTSADGDQTFREFQPPQVYPFNSVRNNANFWNDSFVKLVALNHRPNAHSFIFLATDGMCDSVLFTVCRLPLTRKADTTRGSGCTFICKQPPVGTTVWIFGRL